MNKQELYKLSDGSIVKLKNGTSEDFFNCLSLEDLKELRNTIDLKIKVLEESDDETIESLLLKNMGRDVEDES